MAFDPSVLEALVNPFKAMIESANAKAKRIKAATEDVDESIDEFIADSEHDDMVKFREWRDKMSAQIAEAQAKLAEETDKARDFARSQVAEDLDFDVEALKSEYLEERRQITAQRKALYALAGEDGQEQVDDALSGIEEVIGLKGTRTGGTGAPKPRLSSASVNGVTMEKATFSAVAAYLKSEFKSNFTAGEVGAEALKAAGTNDWQSLSGEQTFTLTIGDQTVTVNWTPRESESE